MRCADRRRREWRAGADTDEYAHVPASDPIDPSRETARLRVVCVEEFDLLPREHVLDDGCELDSLHDLGFDQHARSIEGPD